MAERRGEAAGGVEIKCPRCGFTQADFKKAGRLGCPECYQTFAEALEGLLKTMHKGTRHVGKIPVSLRQSRDLSDRLTLLQKKLSKAKAVELRKLRLEAMNLQDIEDNPLDAEDIAMFEMFERERWLHERCRAYILEKARRAAVPSMDFYLRCGRPIPASRSRHRPA